MRNANLLIVNHALFMSDLALRGSGASLLPEYDVAIFDEAHTMEAVAGDHLGLRITSGQVDFALNRLYHDRTARACSIYHGLGDAVEQRQAGPQRGRPLLRTVAAWQGPGRARRTAGSASPPACPTPWGRNSASSPRPSTRGSGRSRRKNSASS